MEAHGALLDLQAKLQPLNFAGNKTTTKSSDKRIALKSAAVLIVFIAHAITIASLTNWKHAFTENIHHSEIVLSGRLIAENSQSAGAQSTSTAEIQISPTTPSTISHQLAQTEPVPPSNAIVLEKSISHYFEPDQVETPALPVGEWAIHAEVIPFGNSLRITAKLWISAEGTIERWELLNDDPNALASKVVKDINKTIMNGAQIGNHRVASIKYVEFVIEHSTIE